MITHEILYRWLLLIYETRFLWIYPQKKETGRPKKSKTLGNKSRSQKINTPLKKRALNETNLFSHLCGIMCCVPRLPFRRGKCANTKISYSQSLIQQLIDKQSIESILKHVEYNNYRDIAI